MSAAEWSPYWTYVTGDTVQYAGLYYTASATNRNVAPLPTNPTWVLSGSGGGGGIVTLSLAGDLISANPGGSSVDVGTATTVAATAQKTTAQSYDVGLLETSIDGDFAVKAGLTTGAQILSSGAASFNGNVTLKGDTNAVKFEDSAAVQQASIALNAPGGNQLEIMATGVLAAQSTAGIVVNTSNVSVTLDEASNSLRLATNEFAGPVNTIFMDPTLTTLTTGSGANVVLRLENTGGRGGEIVASETLGFMTVEAKAGYNMSVASESASAELITNVPDTTALLQVNTLNGPTARVLLTDAAGVGSVELLASSGALGLGLDAATGDLTLTGVPTVNNVTAHNVGVKADTNGLDIENWLKVKLGGNDIWIPYLTTDPSL
jgi:hypothetical protein